MVEWTVDARNPGEVLACAGLAHLAWREAPGAETGFVRAGDWGGPVRRAGGGAAARTSGRDSARARP